MAGWDLKKGIITQNDLTEDHIWSLFNFVFSDACRKRNTYKYGLIKSILDNVFNGIIQQNGDVYFPYRDIFAKFSENYWNLVVKYDLRQMRKDGKSVFSKIEQILKDVVADNDVLEKLEYDSIDERTKRLLVYKVTLECKRFVIGALYNDFDGVIYSFDLSGEGIYLNHSVYAFILKYKMEIEKLNYYSWARFLEQINDDDALIRVIDKLELSTPCRNDLSVYRVLLHKEFEEDTCFYCGKKLLKKMHVDHFIPWSFVKDDKLWNFVLACPSCNIKKNVRIPSREYLSRMDERNKLLCKMANPIVEVDFENYRDGLIERIWQYARLSGIKEYCGSSKKV